MLMAKHISKFQNLINQIFVVELNINNEMQDRSLTSQFFF